MHTSIRTNYFIAYLFLIISTLLLAKHYGYQMISDTLMDEKETSLYKEANLIAQNYVFDIDSLTTFGDTSASQLRDRLESLQAMSDIRFWLADNTGLILIDSSDSSNKEGTNINQFDNTFLGNQTYTGHLPEELLPDEILAIIYPLTSNQQVSGYLVLMASLENLRQKTEIYVNDLILILLLFFVILFLIFILLARQAIQPVNMMTKAIREYSNGHFDYPMEKVSGYEYREFAAAIQYLATKMQNMNDYQKKFITNISHDFRSPLTSIKGYTEAMLDGTIEPQMQEKYLNIILFETERLTKLTGNLLELSRFENNGIPLEPSTFDINDTLRSTISAFEQQCTEKRISIQMITDQKLLLVDADEGKIEQVIQNLLDNAIKFSHHDSSIEVHTMERTGKAFVSIKDHGIGIPKENLPRIWDRFYKSDLSRGRDKTGTGLGLSITKEILEAHNEHINVISTVGVGTEFTFTLRSHSS